ncbi:MAG: thiol-disulfide oxidoreductase DCC family protein [Saprospiraceae bacterium]
MKHTVILFDGVCNLCNGFVQFTIERDKDQYFKFASLQSEVAKEILKPFGLDNQTLSTVILVENGKCYTKSTAGLRIMNQFGGLWSLVTVLLIFPKFIRDVVYDFIARNRYKWFGEKESCWIPTPELKQRFL